MNFKTVTVIYANRKLISGGVWIKSISFLGLMSGILMFGSTAQTCPHTPTNLLCYKCELIDSLLLSACLLHPEDCSTSFPIWPTYVIYTAADFGGGFRISIETQQTYKAMNHNRQVLTHQLKEYPPESARRGRSWRWIVSHGSWVRRFQNTRSIAEKEIRR